MLLIARFFCFPTNAPMVFLNKLSILNAVTVEVIVMLSTYLYAEAKSRSDFVYDDSYVFKL